MSKINSFLVVIIFIQFFVITLLCCYAWQRDMNEKVLFNQVEKEILNLEEKNRKQDSIIAEIIRTKAQGWTLDQEKKE